MLPQEQTSTILPIMALIAFTQARRTAISELGNAGR